MTQEDKNLLMQDLSARLRYGVKFPVEIWDEDAEPGNESKIIDTTLYSINTDGYCKCLDDSEDIYIENVKPWLRPMNSITRKEREVIGRWLDVIDGYKIELDVVFVKYLPEYIEFLDRNMIDWRGLINKGLANKVTKEHNPYTKDL